MVSLRSLVLKMCPFAALIISELLKYQPCCPGRVENLASRGLQSRRKNASPSGKKVLLSLLPICCCCFLFFVFCFLQNVFIIRENKSEHVCNVMSSPI